MGFKVQGFGFRGSGLNEGAGLQNVHGLGRGRPLGGGTHLDLPLVAQWIHFTLFGIISPTIKLKVCTFFGAYELSN